MANGMEKKLRKEWSFSVTKPRIQSPALKNLLGPTQEAESLG
jgi:hypothetical protein